LAIFLKNFWISWKISVAHECCLTLRALFRGLLIIEKF
jgi:hypothetical protein